MWRDGISICCDPSYSQERKDWTVAAVLQKDWGDVSWDDRYEQFIRNKATKDIDKPHNMANDLYDQYLQNGVARELSNRPVEELELKSEPVLQNEPDWMELYQQWLSTLICQNRYTEIQSYENWLPIETKRAEEEAALEAEIWELQQKLIQLQSERLKRKSNSN